jgi:hypothetical protein
MSDKKIEKHRLPRWVWFFAAACFAIPVLTIGGAIPTAIGFVGAFYCMAVARQANKSTRKKLVRCMGTTAACWILFLVLVGTVASVRTRVPAFLQTEHTRPAVVKQIATSTGLDQLATKAKESVLTGEAKRREIYALAVRMRKHMERVNKRRSERKARGLDLTVVDRQKQHIERMQEKDLEFAVRFYKITREQLDEIIAEGDRKGWTKD